LEDYLDVQIKDGQHDCFANLAILKLYQFNPNMSNAKVVIDILLLALVSTPTIDSPDFSLAQSLALDRPSQAMLKQQNYDDEDDAAGHVDEIETVMPYLQKLWALLKECKFREFWNVWKSDKSDGAEGEQRASASQYTILGGLIHHLSAHSDPKPIPPQPQPRRLLPASPDRYDHRQLVLLHPDLASAKVARSRLC
jgi:hypothetical protein